MHIGPKARLALLLLTGSLLLTGCRQSITIPDQDFLIKMGSLNACWRNNGSAAQCNCAVEKVRNRYATTGQLDTALNDPALRPQAEATIKSAMSSCGL